MPLPAPSQEGGAPEAPEGCACRCRLRGVPHSGAAAYVYDEGAAAYAEGVDGIPESVPMQMKLAGAGAGGGAAAASAAVQTVQSAMQP